MNNKQKITLIIVVIVIAFMLLFPPFITQCPCYSATTFVNEGYRFLFSPPASSCVEWNAAPVNIGMLITQWIGVLMIGGLVFFILKDNK